MNIAIRDSIVNNYFRFMKNWDIDTKKDMIIKLTASINFKTKNKFDFSSCYGAWKDNRNSDDIINELRRDRVNIREIEEF